MHHSTSQMWRRGSKAEVASFTAIFIFYFVALAGFGRLSGKVHYALLGWLVGNSFPEKATNRISDSASAKCWTFHNDDRLTFTE